MGRLISTSNSVMWIGPYQYAQDSESQMALNTKPTFSFEYDTLKYYFHEQEYDHTDTTSNTTNTYIMTTEQMAEMDTFVGQMRSNTPIVRPAVDANGFYVGIIQTTDPRYHKTCVPPANYSKEFIYDFSANTFVPCYFYDANNYITTNAANNWIGYTKVAPTIHYSPIPLTFNVSSNTWLTGNVSLHSVNSITSDYLAIKTLQLNLGAILTELYLGGSINVANNFISTLANTVITTTNNWVNNNISNTTTINYITEIQQNTINTINLIVSSNDSFNTMTEYMNYKDTTQKNIFNSANTGVIEDMVISQYLLNN